MVLALRVLSEWRYSSQFTFTNGRKGQITKD
jgi:hypothetical protein